MMDNDLSYMCSSDSPPPPGYWDTIVPERKDTKELVWVVCKYCRRYRSYLVTYRRLDGYDWEGVHCDCCGVELRYNRFTLLEQSGYENKQLNPLDVEHKDNVWEGSKINYDEIQRKLVPCVCGRKPKIGRYHLVENQDSDFDCPQLGVYCSCGLCTGGSERGSGDHPEFGNRNFYSDNLLMIQDAVAEWNRRSRCRGDNLVQLVLKWIQERAAVNDEYDDSEDE